MDWLIPRHEPKIVGPPRPDRRAKRDPQFHIRGPEEDPDYEEQLPFADAPAPEPSIAVIHKIQGDQAGNALKSLDRRPSIDYDELLSDEGIKRANAVLDILTQNKEAGRSAALLVDELITIQTPFVAKLKMDVADPSAQKRCAEVRNLVTTGLILQHRFIGSSFGCEWYFRVTEKGVATLQRALRGERRMGKDPPSET